MWNLIPGEGSAEKVLELLEDRMKVEALRTYLFTYSTYYDSMSLPQLCDMFELPKNRVHSIVSKMIVSEDIYAAWDQVRLGERE